MCLYSQTYPGQSSINQFRRQIQFLLDLGYAFHHLSRRWKSHFVTRPAKDYFDTQAPFQCRETSQSRMKKAGSYQMLLTFCGFHLAKVDLKVRSVHVQPHLIVHLFLIKSLYVSILLNLCIFWSKDKGQWVSIISFGRIVSISFCLLFSYLFH